MKKGLFIISAIIGFTLVSMIAKNNTIPKDLGLVDGRFKELPNTPNAISTQTDQNEKKVEPLKFKTDLETSKKAIIDSIDKYGKYNLIKEEYDYIHVEFITPTMRFKDDFELYFDEEKKEIHIRSSSRIGYSDGGLNKRRYDEISNTYYSNQ